MKMLRSAIRLYPALWSPDEENADTLADVVPREVELDFGLLGEPPAEGRAHWEAVWRAYHSALYTTTDTKRIGWEEKKRIMTALAKKLPALPVPVEKNDHRLIALLPPSPGLGPKWVAVYLHPDHFELRCEASRQLRNEWSEVGVHVERVKSLSTVRRSR